jgi:hypothetical protein
MWMGYSAPIFAGPSLDYHYAIGHGALLAISRDLAPISRCITETILTLSQVPSPSEEKIYLHARPAGSIFCPFECDECLLYRLTGCPSQIDNKMHRHLLDYICRANLDAFWSRSLNTLKGLRRMFNDEIQIGNSLGFKMSPTSMGPFPTHYDGGGV